MTQTVKAIIKFLGLVNDKVKVDFLTATGKSKHHLTHRLSFPVQVLTNDSNLEGDFLILFESQMMGSEMVYEVLQKVEHQHVLIVGDTQQITPKECLDFKKLTESTLPVIALTEQFRWEHKVK